jgi:hypothetical protein
MKLNPDACYRALAARDARFDGRLFVAVHTTGVYCRPICPARTPKRENVTFYPTASAAQEAGFRPCLRCRPECSPDLAVWRGTSNTVSRARPDRRRRARSSGGRCPGGAARGRRAPAAPAVQATSRRLADRGRADPPRAVRQAADRRNHLADDRDRAGTGTVPVHDRSVVAESDLRRCPHIGRYWGQSGR